ncbi:MAG: antitoxin [Nitrospinae bacterium]|nr:antitoxin [Nitrospinota bacterium]
MQKKLTLRLEEDLIQRVKRCSGKTGKAISQIVAAYFSLLDGKPSAKSSDLTPVAESLKGVINGSRVKKEDYKRHLEEK